MNFFKKQNLGKMRSEIEAYTSMFQCNIRKEAVQKKLSKSLIQLLSIQICRYTLRPFHQNTKRLADTKKDQAKELGLEIYLNLNRLVLCVFNDNIMSTTFDNTCR